MSPPRDAGRLGSRRIAADSHESSESAGEPVDGNGPRFQANPASLPSLPVFDPFGVDVDPTCAGSIVLALDRDGVRLRRTGPRWWDAVAYGPRLPACDVCAPELEAYIANLVAGLGDCERPEGFVVRGAIRVLVDRAVARAVRGKREKARAARLEADRQAELERLAVGRR